MPNQPRQLRSSAVLVLLIALALLLAAGGADAGRQTPRQEGRPPTAQRDAKASTRAEAEADRAVSTSPLARPFKRLWHYVDEVTTLPPSLDRSAVYLPLTGGRVVGLDRESGAKLWESDLGGIVSAAVAVGEAAVYVATRKLAEDGSEAGASLRALDKSTGLTLWSKDYPRPFTSPLTVHGGRLYAGSADGSFYAIAAADGGVLWKSATQDVVRGGALVTESVVYFGSDDGAMRGVELEKGREVFLVQTQGRVIGAPVADEHLLYFGSGDGYVYAVDKRTGKRHWRSRTGAAVEASPALVSSQDGTKQKERLLVGSFDNFVYGLSRANGDRIWKRRLENRIAATPVVVGDAAMVAPLRGDHVAFFLHEDGRRINFYRLEREVEIVASPLFADNLLLLSTNKGLVAATPGAKEALPKEAPPVETQTQRRPNQVSWGPGVGVGAATWRVGRLRGIRSNG